LGVAAAYLLACSSSASPGRPVRLRSQPVAPRFAKDLNDPQALAAKGPLFGLFLVQTTGPISTEQRAQLLAMGVDLVRYVPEETFIARFQAARGDAVRALPYVQWIGDFRPEHKMHRALAALAKATIANETADISVLLVPRTRPADVDGIKQMLVKVEQQSNLRSGAILRGTISASSLQVLAASPAVLWIEPRRPMKLFDEVASKIVAGDAGPNTLISQSLGYTGAGVGVAVADSGLNNGDAATMHPDLLGRTPAFFY